MRTPDKVIRHGEAFSLIPDALLRLYGDNEVRGLVQEFEQWSANHIIKDVLAVPLIPYLTDSFNVLHVLRPAADVIYLRLYRQHFSWELELLPPSLRGNMPSPSEYVAINNEGKLRVHQYKEQLVDSILWGQLVLEDCAHASVGFDALTSRPDALCEALTSLGYRPQFNNYLTPEFIKVREQRLSIRRTPEYKEIQSLVRKRYDVVREIWEAYDANLF